MSGDVFSRAGLSKSEKSRCRLSGQTVQFWLVVLVVLFSRKDKKCQNSTADAIESPNQVQVEQSHSLVQPRPYFFLRNHYLLCLLI